MDERKSSKCNSADATAPRFFQRRDGSWAVVFIDDKGLPTIAKMIIVPNFSPVDHFEDAFLKARKTLQDSLVAGDANAFPQFDFRVGEALQVLLEALKR